MKRALRHLVLALLCGCTSLDRFRLEEGEVWRGLAVGSSESCESGSCSVIRRGFDSRAELTLDFDITSGSGTMSTENETCGPSLRDVPFRTITPLEHDQLSLFDFPGAERIRNFIVAFRPTTGPFAGRDGMAFISLLNNGAVEARVVIGDGTNDCSPSDCTELQTRQCDAFGYFVMERSTRE